MKKIYFCTECGNEMTYTGGLDEAEYNTLAETDELDWECQKCGAEGCLKWDDTNKESYVDIVKEYTYEEIYEDPIGNQPNCCVGCNSAYPECLSSCKIFDD